MSLDSTGQRIFETLALETLESWTLVPAQFNGHPIDSAIRFKFKFQVPGHPRGAREQFRTRYIALTTAIDRNDKAAADAALAKLDVQNLYEDAFTGLTDYSYALRYGSIDQQLVGLKRAIANESAAHYLPQAALEAALANLLRLQISTNRFGEAMDTWTKLQKVGTNKPAIEQFRPFIEQVKAVRSDDTPYGFTGEFEDDRWFIDLFTSNFRIDVVAGQISTLKLRWEQTYRPFGFNPDLDYHVACKFGPCELEIEGSPGTRFKSVQF